MVFTVGNVNLEYVNQYKYLGLMISEHLDMKVTADHVAKAASRALGLLIAKSKAMGGIPYNCFKKLYESIVLSVIHYGSAVWGQNQFTSINAIHNRACRHFSWVLVNIHQMQLSKVIWVCHHRGLDSGFL